MLAQNRVNSLLQVRRARRMPVAASCRSTRPSSASANTSSAVIASTAIAAPARCG